MIGILIEQVVFNDTFGGAELSAVQVDEESSYKAEDTSFLGFYGEVCTSAVVLGSSSRQPRGTIAAVALATL